MDFGVGYFPTHDGMRPAEVARMVEERGQDALFIPDHTHIPAAVVTQSSGALQRKYVHIYDQFVALAAAAAATTTLRIGSGVTLVVERDPIITAKEVASIDHMSGGRFEFGVGAGWNREEMRNHGTDPRTRMALMRERVEAMKQIWTRHEASYQGRFVSFDRIWSYPKPAQRPHPPILVGGGGPTVLDRVLAYGDCWLPHFTGEEVFDRMEELRARADRPIEIQFLDTPVDPTMFERMADAGVRRANHWLPAGPRSIVERALDRWETAIRHFNGE